MAVNSKGHIFVFTRSNSANGPAYAPTAAQLLEFVGLSDYADEEARNLPFGHQRRLEIARALALRPRLLLLHGNIA